LAPDRNTVAQATPSFGADRVYVVDDDPAVRRALTRLLRSHGLQATSFASAEDLLAAVQPDEAPTCLVVDLRMPGISGLDLQDLLLQQGLDMAIVFVSGRASLESGIRAMKGGAVDFLEKPVSEGPLLAAVRSALDQDRRRRTQRSHRALLQARYDTLTPREREVFGLIVAGLLNKQVGAELGTAEKTIKVHRARVMQKMEAGSLVELVRMADKLGRPGEMGR
jgi:FixJ family two-component response regulator